MFLVGVGAAWSAANIGPAVSSLRDDFDISLATVGLLSGTLTYVAMVIGLILAPRIALRLGLARWLMLGCLCGGVGNLLFALTPVFAGLALGRVLAGLGLGLAVGLGPVLARLGGGFGRVGLFGAAYQLGIGCGSGSAVRWPTSVSIGGPGFCSPRWSASRLCRF